jgi:hypothetical protein
VAQACRTNRRIPDLTEIRAAMPDARCKARPAVMSAAMRMAMEMAAAMMPAMSATVPASMAAAVPALRQNGPRQNAGKRHRGNSNGWSQHRILPQQPRH